MTKVLVVGDRCTDIFIYGEINRISPEAPVPVFNSMHQSENGGMAENVVSNLEALGCEVKFISNFGDIKKVRFVDARSGQMVLRVDENDFCEKIDIDWTILDEKYDAVVISDYNKGFLTEKDIIQITSLFSQVPIFLDTKKFLGKWCDGIDFIKINSLEHQKNFETIPKYPKLHKKLIVTLGKDGCKYNDKIYPTEEVPVRDVSGAGDTFLAGLVYQYINTKDISKAIIFAQECTTKVVQKHGVSTV